MPDRTLFRNLTNSTRVLVGLDLRAAD